MTSSPLIAEPTVYAVPEPPSTLLLTEDIEAVWQDPTVLIRFSPVTVLEMSDDGAAFIDPHAIGRLANSSNFTARHTAFQETWMAWKHHPGRYGAVPATTQGAGDSDSSQSLSWLRSRRWFAPQHLPAHSNTPFGVPYLTFAGNEWQVQMSGLRAPLQSMPWDDEARIQEAVINLGNTDYWHALAALHAPQDWANALAGERRRQRQAAAERKRQAENARAARAFTENPDLKVSTIVIARALRNFSWADYARHEPGSPILIHRVHLVHCDFTDSNGKPFRAAQCVDIEWSRFVTPETIRAIHQTLSEHLGTYGYETVLARSKRIYIARDAELLREHLPAVSQHRRDKPIITIF